MMHEKDYTKENAKTIDQWVEWTADAHFCGAWRDLYRAGLFGPAACK